METIVEEELELKFNSKTQIFPLKNGVDFLGFHFYLSNTGKVVKKLKTTSKKRYKHRMRKLKNSYNDGTVELEEVFKCFPGYNGHLKRGHTYKLRKHVMKDFVLVRHNEEETISE